MNLFDTSVFIAGIVADHPHHEPSSVLINKVLEGKMKGAVCIHTLAECYAVLTSLPVTPAIPPEMAYHLIGENILARFRVIELSVADYRAAIERISQKGLRSGAVFDALIVQAAVKKKLAGVYTWNKKHFSQIAGSDIPILHP